MARGLGHLDGCRSVWSRLCLPLTSSPARWLQELQEPNQRSPGATFIPADSAGRELSRMHIQNEHIRFQATASGVGSLFLLVAQRRKVPVRVQKKQLSSMADVGSLDRAAFVSGLGIWGKVKCRFRLH